MNSEQLKARDRQEKKNKTTESVSVCLCMCVCAIIITCELYSQCSLSDGCNHRLRAWPSSSDLSFGKQHNAIMTPALVGCWTLMHLTVWSGCWGQSLCQSSIDWYSISTSVEQYHDQGDDPIRSWCAGYLPAAESKRNDWFVGLK